MWNATWFRSVTTPPPEGETSSVGTGPCTGSVFGVRVSELGELVVVCIYWGRPQTDSLFFR